MEQKCALLCCLVVTGQGRKEADRGISRLQSHLVPACFLYCSAGVVQCLLHRLNLKFGTRGQMDGQRISLGIEIIRI